MAKENRDTIFEKISNERDYQDHMCSLRQMQLEPTVEGEIVMLKTYVDKTLILWTEDPKSKAVLAEMRKIAGIAIRCLENHGCPKRDLMDGVTNGDS